MPELQQTLGNNSPNFSSAHDQLAKDETRSPMGVFVLLRICCSTSVCAGVNGVGIFGALEVSGDEGLPFWLTGKLIQLPLRLI